MKSPYLVWCVVFNVFYPSPSWNLLPSMGIYMYLRLYDSFVTSYFKDIACVCVVCRCSCNFYYCPGRNQWFLLRDFPIEFQKCHFIPGFIFFSPSSMKNSYFSVYPGSCWWCRNNWKYLVLIVLFVSGLPLQISEAI